MLGENLARASWRRLREAVKKVRRRLRRAWPNTRKREMWPLRHPGPYSPGLWGELERVFAWHADETPYHVLNRCAQKRATSMGVSIPSWLDATTCTIRREHWSSDQLRAIEPTGYHTTIPRDDTLPIVAVEIGNRIRRIDGGARVKTFVREGRSADVLIVTPKPQH